MFILKKIVSPFFLPLSMVLLFSVFGLFLLWFTSRQRLGKTLITLALAMLVFFSYGTTSDILLKSLENRYPPISDDIFSSDLPPKLVVVLGGGHAPDRRFPVTSWIGCDSLTRLMEGIRIYRRIQGGKLILSGGIVFGSKPVAEVMAEVARSVGVNEQDMIIESRSRDTEDEAVILKSMLGKERFILVTSASHMPRAMALFNKLDMDPLPAPTMHMVHEPSPWGPDMFFPSSSDLRKAELAFHEYLGIGWLKLRGRI